MTTTSSGTDATGELSVSTRPPLPPVYERHIAQLQERVRTGGFSLADMPGYVEGQPPSPERWQNTDYLEIYSKVWGREYGANGIGKLREVALIEITENERWPYYKEAPEYLPGMGLQYADLDVKKMQDQSAAYQAAMESAGVLVHRIAYPDPPVGPFGPTRGTWAANELLVVRGGSIIEKVAISPFGTGRSEYLALWAFTQLAIPPVLAIMGTGVAEAGPCFWLAEDVFVAARGLAFNDEGLNQLLPVVRRSSGLDEKDFKALVIDCPGGRYFDAGSGVSHHPDMALGPLDAKKVICYPSGLDYGTWSWLKEHDYEMIEVTRDEQALYAPANVMILEPGRVIMHAEAKDAVAAVRKAGVDVIEVPYSEFLRTGGGLHCSTMRIWREPGPFSPAHS
jgi:N-dimethylarginine dimethylaminohydrolase